jgi:hypothetical protein
MSHWILALKREARQRGLCWADVRECYAELRETERERRQHPNELRETAWCIATTPGSWPFWRHGFLSRFGRLVARGKDYTSIPRYDTIAQEVAWHFPEYTDDHGTARLWDFLLSPYDRLPDAETLWRKAIEMAAHRSETPILIQSSVAF